MDLTIRQSLVRSVAVVGSAFGADREGAMVVGSMRQPAFLSFPRCLHDRNGHDRSGHDREQRPNCGALRTGRSAGTAGGFTVSITPLWARTPWETTARLKPCGPRGKRGKRAASAAELAAVRVRARAVAARIARDKRAAQLFQMAAVDVSNEAASQEGDADRR